MKNKLINLLFLLLIMSVATSCLYKKTPDQAEIFFHLLQQSPSEVEDAEGNVISPAQLVVDRKWEGNICKATVKNIGDEPLQLTNIILFDLPEHGLNPESRVYGEGFQMLAQNGGTLDSLINIGPYPDPLHYGIPNVHGLATAYGVMAISINPEDLLLLGFTSCHRFIGRISYDHRRMLISLDAEGLELKPGECWQLEDFIVLNGNDCGWLFDQLADAIAQNHPPRKTRTIPTGWCSWYGYGPTVTHHIIEENLDIFSSMLPELKYIQLDDGYQSYMGDWLDKNPAYGDIQKTLKTIRDKGFEPAIWVAPFIAEEDSRIFKEHPDWFVKDTDGTPLNSSKIGFGGWRNGPWYLLDGTHPEVQKHLQHIFQVMRKKWGINYFKLDANYWGAIHGGVHYDKNATRIEAYRLGMKAILKGCDENTVVLGCNAPIWPSLGLVTAMRTSGDMNRDWNTIKSTAFENLCRAWQNGKLWDSDPDCVLLANDTLFSGKKEITQNEWIFHATAVHAVGGLVLSGDKASNLKENEVDILKKLLHPTGKGASFFDTKMETGITDLGKTQYYYYFNWGEKPIDLSIQLKTKSKLTDYWTDENMGVHEGEYLVKKLEPHSARLIVAEAK